MRTFVVRDVLLSDNDPMTDSFPMTGSLKRF